MGYQDDRFRAHMITVSDGTMFSMATTKGRCSICDHEKEVQHGKIVLHYVWTKGPNRELVKCAGSGRAPKS